MKYTQWFINQYNLLIIQHFVILFQQIFIRVILPYLYNLFWEIARVWKLIKFSLFEKFMLPVYPVLSLKCIEIVKTFKTDYTKIWHTRIRRGQQKFRVEKSIAWTAARVFPELVKKMSTTKLFSTRWKLKIWIFKYPYFVRASLIRFFFFSQYLFHISTKSKTNYLYRSWDRNEASYSIIITFHAILSMEDNI